MSIFNSQTQREIVALKEIEARLEGVQRRERVLRFVVGGMTLVSALAYVLGRVHGGGKGRRYRR